MLSIGVFVIGASLITRSSVLRRQQTVLHGKLRERERDLGQANSDLSKESRRDALTGLSNRLRLREDFAELTSELNRGRSFCLVLCDLDHFKAFNDALGHQAGDKALRRAGAVLDGGSRGTDRVYRYGGEEILIILREQDIERGEQVAERHRVNLERAGIRHPANSPSRLLTLSAGVAAHRTGESPDDVLRRADWALYQAKERGRNQIAVAEPADDEALAAAGTARPT